MQKNYFKLDNALKVKDIDTVGRIVVLYAAAFGGEPDSHNDEIVPGAFTKTIAEFGPLGANRIKHLHQHDPFQILGMPRTLAEDNYGLLAHSHITKNRLGDDVLALEADGYYEHSIGYKPTRQERDKTTGVNRIKEMMVKEYSSVTWGSNANTPAIEIKSTEQLLSESEAIVKRFDLMLKIFRKGELMDETYQSIELELEQLRESFIDLSEKSALVMAPELDSTPEPIVTKQAPEIISTPALITELKSNKVVMVSELYKAWNDTNYKK